MTVEKVRRITRGKVGDWIERAAASKEANDDLLDLDAETLADVIAMAEWWKAGVNQIISEAKERMAVVVGEGGHVKRAGFVYRVKPGREWKVYEDKQTELIGLIHEAGPEMVDKCFNANNARITGLREVLAGYVDAETGAVGVDAFLEWSDTDQLTVNVMPVDNKYVPKFLKEAEDGVKFGVKR